MPDDPWYIKLLDRMGVNTTRLRWRLYQQEKKARQMLASGGPVSLHWLKYPHKICPHCRAVSDRKARTCSSCGRRLPTMFGYRARRLVHTVVPQEGPVVTNVFLGLMVAFYAIQLGMDGLGFQSIMSPSSAALYVLGAFTPRWAVGEGEYWRFLSFGLIHGGIIHIGFNGYALMQVGRLVESQISRARMIVLVTLTQVASGYASYVWYYLIQGNAGVPTVGASGWLFGLIGFGIAYFHQVGTGARPMRDALLRWAVFILIFGFIVPGINNAAHVGGLVAGLAFAYVPEGTVRRARQSEAAWSTARWVCLALWVATLVFMVRSIIVVWPQFANG